MVRRALRAALAEVRSILKRLNHRSGVPVHEQKKLVADLSTALETVGDWLRQVASDVLESAAAAVRGALKKAAREQIVTSWARLERQLGSALPRMDMADRIQVLVLVDRATPADQALLSSLVIAGYPEMWTSYRTVGGELGLDIPANDDDLHDVLEADVQQVHQGRPTGAGRQSSTAPPPLLPLKASGGGGCRVRQSAHRRPRRDRMQMFTSVLTSVGPGLAQRTGCEEDSGPGPCARGFEPAGGSIRSAVVTAAYAAAGRGESVTGADLLAGARREYRKAGRLVLEDVSW